MKVHAYQQCIDPGCGLRYPIQESRIHCDREHLLDVRYKGRFPKYLRDVFYGRRNHGGNIYNESGVWRFRELINFSQIDTESFAKCAKVLVSLDGAEGRLSRPYRMTKVAEFVDLKPENLLLQPEGYNPSGSFKDNGMSTAVTHAKMLGVKRIICASTGNTSASAGMYASNEGMDCDVFIPKGEVAPGKLGQAFQFGAQVIEINGNFDDALAASLEEAARTGAYVVNSINPFRLEGQKTIIYRVLEHLRWQRPDWIVYPGGALGNTSSAGKALIELHEWGWMKKVPRIAVINSEGANTLYTLYNGKYQGVKLRWNKGRAQTDIIDDYYGYMDKNQVRPKTEATAIQIGRPSNILKALRALEFTKGVVEQVTDKEMYDGMSVVGLNGFDCELASGAVPAGIKKLREQGVIAKDDTVVGILTGRQKDPNIPVKYHLDPANRFANPPKGHGS
ncbi:MAG: threonine synthase [Nitrososphaerales archaeon]